MKLAITNRLPISSAILSTLLLLCLVFSSCSNSKSLDDLLKTVPEKAGFVAVINGDVMSKNTGGMDKFFNNMPADLAKSIDASELVVFADDKSSYITGVVSDEDAFKKTVEQKVGATFQENSGVEVCKYVALKDGQFWWLMDRNMNITPSDINKYIDQDEDKSFLKNPCCEKMLAGEADFSFVTEWSYALNLMGMMNPAARQSLTMANMASAVVFDDAKYLAGTMALNGNKMSIDTHIYNGKGEPAELLLPFSNVQESVLSSLPGSTNVVMAINIDQNVINYIKPLLAKFAGNLAPDTQALLGTLDGTIAFEAGSFNDGFPTSLALKAKTTEPLPTYLRAWFGQECDMTYEDGVSAMIFGTPMQGPLTKEKYLPLFKDVYFGFVADLSGQQLPNAMTFFSFTVGKDGKGIKAHAEVQTQGSLVEALKSL